MKKAEAQAEEEADGLFGGAPAEGVYSTLPAMSDSVVHQTVAEARRDSRSGLGRLRTRWPALTLLVLATPLVAYSVVRSFVWFEGPFPGFFLMENAVVPTVGGVDWPREAETIFHSRVVAIDGRPVESSADVYGYVAGFPAGHEFDYRFEKEGVALRREIASMEFSLAAYLETCGILLGFGGLSLGVALIVGFLQPSTLQARVYLLQGAVAGLYPVTAVFLHQPDFPLLSSLCLALECFFPATFVHLALVFPVEHRFRGLRRALPFLPYGVSAGLAFLALRGFHGQPPSMAASRVAYLYTAFSIAFFIAAVGWAYWENREPLARARVKAILPGLILGMPVVFYAFVNNALLGGDFPVQFGLVLPVLFYACVAYAVARHDLFDVDRLVRLSFVYGTLTVVAMAAYALAVAVPTWLFPSVAGHQAYFGSAFIVLLAVCLDPLRRGIQRVVDRAFYRTRLDYRATVSDLSEVLTTLLDVREVVGQVTRVLTDAMHVESAAIALLPIEGDAGVQWTRRAPHGGESRTRRLSDLREERSDPSLTDVAAVFRAAPQVFHANSVWEATPQQARERVQRFFTELGASIVLPLLLRGEPSGVLVLGHKRSGRPFGSDDVEILRTLANQTAIAVQNARSYEALAILNRDLDEKVQQRTEELRASHTELSRAYEELKGAQAQLVQSEKMASLGQLVAGAAHELNNPASLVHGSLANLADYVGAFIEVIHAYERAPAGERTQADAVAALRADKQLDFLLRETPELLRICSEGSERVKKIVEDLRIFARADQGDRAPTDVTEGLESTIRLLGAELRQRGVVVSTLYGDVPQIEAQAGLLNQVWMNLLTNALDAVEGRPEPRIGVRVEGRNGSAPNDEAWVEVEVRDNGAGIEPRHRDRIFEPFFTTKPVGRGTGLGLSIAYGTIKSHGGTIDVDSEPERGTSITVRLPVRRPAAPV